MVFGAVLWPGKEMFIDIFSFYVRIIIKNNILFFLFFVWEFVNIEFCFYQRDFIELILSFSKE